MSVFLELLELVGTVAFAVSGAMLGIKKQMDLFGVCMMGLVTACGGGMLRDLFLGTTPPAVFRDPSCALVAAAVSMAFFMAARRHLFHAGVPAFEQVMLLADSMGLGVFTAAGVSAAVQSGFGDSIAYCVFLGTLTGVGGGTLRDVLAGLPPYIFVKHIYACASIAGAVACALLWRSAGQTCAVMVCFMLVFLIRILAARFHWSLPKAV